MGIGLACALCGKQWISGQDTEKKALAEARRMIKKDPCPCEVAMSGMSRTERLAYLKSHGANI